MSSFRISRERSLYQSLRNLSGTVLRSLRGRVVRDGVAGDGLGYVVHGREDGGQRTVDRR